MSIRTDAEPPPVTKTLLELEVPSRANVGYVLGFGSAATSSPSSSSHSILVVFRSDHARLLV